MPVNLGCCHVKHNICEYTVPALRCVSISTYFNKLSDGFIHPFYANKAINR